MTTPRADDGNHERVPSGAELEELLRSTSTGDTGRAGRSDPGFSRPRRPIAPPYTPPPGRDAGLAGTSVPPSPGPAAGPDRSSYSSGPIPRAAGADPRPGRTGTAGPPEPSGDGVVRLGIWGGVSSGKTTFLYTLPSAAYQSARSGGRGRWTVVPLDRQSQNYYELAARAVEGDLQLPQGTVKGDSFRLAWRLEERSRRDPLRPWRRVPGRRIELRMTDRSGLDFEEPTDELIGELAAAQGIVYLFDPSPEPRREALNFFGVTMSRLRSHMADQLGDGGTLPHHLAVCVSKFDETEIFSLARRGYWVTQELRSPFRPRIEDARGFFEWLCDDPQAGGAATVKEQIQAYFDPRRVSYHVTSAVGFHLARHGEFTLDDFDNLDVRDREVRLRGRPRPINVLEPLVQLGDAIRRGP